MLSAAYLICFGTFILLHGAFSPSSSVTLVSSQVVFYTLTYYCGFPQVYDILASFLFAALLHWISTQSCVIYYVKMWSYHVFISFTCLLYLPYLIVKPFGEDSLKWLKLFWRETLPIFGVSVEVRNKENVLMDGPCVIVCNHQSSLDLIAMANIMPPRTTALAKKELKYMGPFGMAAWLSGLIFVDRSNHNSAISTMKHVASIMQERKVKIWIFPEGTRNMNGSLLPFKKGAFRLAIEAQVPILAVVISSYKNILDHSTFAFSSGRVVVTCLPHFSTNGLKLDDLDDLMKNVYQKMFDIFHKTSAEV